MSSSLSEPIENRFESSSDVLDQVAIYYPKQYNKLKLDQATFLGHGADAYAFLVGDMVIKFTQNRAHAKVSLSLVRKRKYKHLVRTYSVAHLPDLNLWCIVEERLRELSDNVRGVLEDFLEEGDNEVSAWIQNGVEAVIIELDSLGVEEAYYDCVTPHNLMMKVSTKRVFVAMDFGFTSIRIKEDYTIWS